MTTFSNLRGVDLSDDLLTVVVPSRFVKTRIEDKLLDHVRRAMDESGAPEVNVRFRVATAEDANSVLPFEEGDLTSALPVTPSATNNAESSTAETTLLRVQSEERFGAGDWDRLDRTHRINNSTILADQQSHSRPSARAYGSRDERVERNIPLNAEHTFADFVSGPSNRFAYAAAQAVAETPGRNYNPLFISGAAGLGKTHLLGSIAHYVRQHYPNKRVKYITTEDFLNEFVDMIRHKSGPEFRKRYREVDVLLIDDVQFMTQGEGFQNEFFHTFNALYQNNSQIVLTSDRPPSELPALEDRIRSRFLSGLVAEVERPDFEMRLAILHKKAESETTAIPNEVLDLIAKNVTDNIRELEGALTRVIAYASLTRESLTTELAQKVLGDIISHDEPRPITPEMILRTTCNIFGFALEDLTGPSRRRPLVTARQIAMYVIRQMTSYSYPAIGEHFGGRDHTTVIHAVDKISAKMKEQRQIYDQVTQLMQAVQNPSSNK